MTTPPPGATVATDSEIASRILAAMKEGGISLLALSDKTGIPYKTLERSIKGGTSGHRSLTIGEFRAVTFALKCNPTELIEDNAA
ncbi:helix-turn-helix domain-containing protein [Arthrobacter sp. NA-172]|uniref:helix-turn-helix domain-containing protein n=1 Tax=Arthrobacter sp. NA-172 TaxID=3367524 RepID=UPI00375486EB